MESCGACSTSMVEIEFNQIVAPESLPVRLATFLDVPIVPGETIRSDLSYPVLALQLETSPKPYSDKWSIQEPKQDFLVADEPLFSKHTFLVSHPASLR